MSKDRLNDELLLVALSDRQRIGADRIIDEGAKVMDMCSNPLARHEIFDGVDRIRDLSVRVCYRRVNNTYE